MINREEYKNKLKSKVLELIKSDIAQVKKQMHNALDCNDFELLDELKKEKEALDLVFSEAENTELFTGKNSNANNNAILSNDTQLVFDMSSIKTVSKRELKMKMIPDKTIVKHHSQLPILCIPERIYIEGDEYIFKSDTWKDALGEICDYCFSLDSVKFKELATHSNCNRIKGSKHDFKYATVEEGDFKCFHGVWFYVRMSSQEAVKLILEILKFMGYEDCEIVVQRKKR